MEKQNRIAVVGGDPRQFYAAKELEKHGWRISLFGTDLPEEIGEVTNVSGTLSEALTDAFAVLLPLPVTRDGKTVPCAGEKIPFAELLQLLPTGAALFAGRIPAEWKALAEERMHPIVDYFSVESLQLRNALVTAEGAIRLAMEALPVTLHGTRTAIVGYGRIGSLLAPRLTALGSRVTVFARRDEVLARAEADRAEYVKLMGRGSESTLCGLSRDCRVLFNTVPYPLMDNVVLRALPRNCLLMELASAPGGFDPEAARSVGLRVLLAPGLPGRFYPESAGKIVAETVHSILNASSDY